MRPLSIFVARANRERAEPNALFAIPDDPSAVDADTYLGCNAGTQGLAESPRKGLAGLKRTLANTLEKHLRETAGPRVCGLSLL